MLSACESLEGLISMRSGSDGDNVGGFSSSSLPEHTYSHNRPIMAICTDGSRCGCSIYSDASIQLVADRKDFGDPYKGLDIIIQRVDPEAVIVSVVQRKLILFLEKRFTFNILDISKKGICKRETENSDSSFLLVIVPNIWFCMSKGLQILIDSDLVKSKGFTNMEEKSLFVTSKIEKSVDVCAIRSISAIDAYIIYAMPKAIDVDASIATSSQQRSETMQSISGNSQSLPTQDVALAEKNSMSIWEVKYVDPGPVLSIDKFTFETLGIFHKKKPRDEENLNPDIQSIPSLFDILNQCQSPQGKRQMRTMMMWPLQDIIELRHRHDTVDYFIRPENKLFRDQMIINLKNIVPLSGLLTKLNHSIGNYRELSIVYKSLWAFIAVCDLIKVNSGHGLEVLNRIVNLDTPDFRAMTDSIVGVIDFEASKRERRVQVCIGINSEVDEKKEVIKNLTKFCDEVAIQETAKYKNSIGKMCNVVYIPRIGFLNNIDYSSTSELLMMRSNREFDILLHTEKSVYFKTPRMIELDNNAGDMACDLIDMQESVVMSLQNDILKYSETILKLMELCGELDCLITFSMVSFERGYVRPEFNLVNQEIAIVKAFHPLHCIRNKWVPNDIKFFKESSEREVKVMILTGPNSCGKTTYMKAACLVIYMAHIGCFVPALQARLPIIDAILTRIHSANSISTGLSSFATDLHQINYALSRATEKSFIVVDEFGKGTRARDGFHLLKGLITYFAVRTLTSPYVIAATHFNRLINHLQNYSEYILYKTFKITRNPTIDNVTYDFQILDGVGEVSLADKVAARAGIPHKIIERANQIRDYITEGRVIKPLSLTEPPRGA